MRKRSKMYVKVRKDFARLTLLLCALCIGFAACASADLYLAVDGEARAVLVLPEEPHENERLAADEIAEHIELISGTSLDVVGAGQEPEGLLLVRIGEAADAGLENEIREKGDDPFAFALFVNDDEVQLRGLSPEGTLAAAYELLEQLGVRWYMPGEIGRVVPENSTVTLSRQQTVQSPSFKGRRGSRNVPDLWNKRLRMGGESRYGRHGIEPFTGRSRRRAAFEENPEFFALIDGERRNRQLCLTNSTDNLDENELFETVVDYYRDYLRENPDTDVLNMGPNDGGGMCECDHCRALDPDVLNPLSTPEPSYTDRYIWFFNHLTDALSDEFPDVRIGKYAYSRHLRWPEDVEPKDNLAISLAPIHVCRRHGPNNPICPESNFPIYAFERWAPYVDVEGGYMGDRGYLYHLADPGFHYPIIHRLREEIPAFYDLGVRVWAADPADFWATQNPGMYVAAKLLWDHTADVDAIVDEFYEKFYGPASEPMRAYHELLDDTVRDAPYHTGSVWDIPLIFTARTMADLRRSLEEAEGLAEGIANEKYATRIEIKVVALDFLDYYIESRWRREEFDFVGEKEAMEASRKMRDRLLEDYEYPMLYERHATNFFSRFVETPAMRNYESTGEGEGEIVARFDYEWKFYQDPQKWGQYVGLHKPESRGINWQSIRTDTSWSNQGLRYYFGQAWYRQSVHVSSQAREHDRINIWFAGVDNTAEVWVNGEFVGANHDGAEFDLHAHGSAFRPFQFDVTDALEYGAHNVVTVRTVRPRTNELGTGGIIGGVMLYAPPEER